jgi:hypothetical protein
MFSGGILSDEGTNAKVFPIPKDIASPHREVNQESVRA